MARKILTVTILTLMMCGGALYAAQIQQPTLAKGDAPGEMEVKDPYPPLPADGSGTQPMATGGPDAAGYTFIDFNEPGGPVYQWVDISGTGTALGDGDDVALGPVTLGAPFSFYGTSYSDLYLCSNGFISTTADAGGDLSNDCPVPSVPSTGTGARIYAVHDDLDLEPGFGQGYYEYFADCPRPHDGGTACGCSIFQWEDVEHWGAGIQFDAQAILYDPGDIVIQVEPGNPEAGSGSTTGIQNEDASIGLTYVCDTAGSLPDSTVVWFRAPPVTLSGTPGMDMACTGAAATYTYTINNNTDADATYDVTYTGFAWTVNGPATVGPVPANGSVDFTVSHLVPDTAASGDTDTGTVTVTDVLDPTASASAGHTTTAITGGEQVLDGDFELGPPPASEWTEVTVQGGEWILDPSGVWGFPAHSGTYCYWSGGYWGGTAETSYVEQTVDVPLVAPELYFWAVFYRPDADEFDGDGFYVEVDGNQEYWMEFTQANDTYPDWVQQGPIDLSAYAGTTVNLRLGNTLVGATTGNALIDDVSIPGSACPEADLSLVKEISNPNPAIGENVTYTITVTNAGPDIATNTVVSDPLPAGVTYVGCTTTMGACAYDAGSHIVTVTVGDMAMGDTVTITIEVTVDEAGSLDNTAIVYSDAGDPNSGDNTSTSTAMSGDYDITLQDDMGRAWCCVNSFTGDWTWTHFSATGGAQTFTGTGLATWRSGILFVTSTPGEPWQLAVRYYRGLETGYGSFIYRAFRVRSSLNDRNAEYLPFICDPLAP